MLSKLFAIFIGVFIVLLPTWMQLISLLPLVVILIIFLIPKEIKHTWPADTCVIVGDSIITGIDEKRLSKDLLVKVHDFRGATLADINHHVIPILKKKPDVIILHVGTNDSVSRILCEILNDLLQLKSVITKTLPNCQVILSQPTP